MKRKFIILIGFVIFILSLLYFVLYQNIKDVSIFFIVELGLKEDIDLTVFNNDEIIIDTTIYYNNWKVYPCIHEFNVLKIKGGFNKFKIVSKKINYEYRCVTFLVSNYNFVYIYIYENDYYTDITSQRRMYY